MIQRKRRDFKKEVRGLAPPIVLSGQPSALLALPKAGNFCNPYLDTVETGSAPGNLHSHDTHVDPEGRLPTHILGEVENPETARSDRLCRAL